MNPEDVGELLRQTGRPLEPPARLRRAILRVPQGQAFGRQPPAWRIRIAAAAAAVLLLATSAAVVQQLTSFHTVAAVTLRGAPGTQAVAELGQPNGPNRPVRLVVQHLKPGAVSYYELWSLAEQPPMMLTTFMTDTTGSCTLTFSMPASASWRDLAVTPEGESSSYLLRSDH
jgi:hypothetical protein